VVVELGQGLMSWGELVGVNGLDRSTYPQLCVLSRQVWQGSKTGSGGMMCTDLFAVDYFRP
jgi:hypothetical protein